MGGVFLVSTYPLKREKGEYYGYAKDMTSKKQMERPLIEKADENEESKFRNNIRNYQFCSKSYLYLCANWGI